MSTQIASSSHRRSSLRFLNVAGSLLLAFATNSLAAAPGCSDLAVVNTVKGVYQDSIDQLLVPLPDSGSIRSKIDAATGVEVNSILTVGKNDAIGRVSCQAMLSVKMPTGLIKVFGTPGNPFYSTAQSLELRTKGNRIEKAIQYTAQPTDDRKQVRVTSRGIADVGQLVATLGRTGLLNDAAEGQSTSGKESGNASVAPKGGFVIRRPNGTIVASSSRGALSVTDDGYMLWRGEPLEPPMQVRGGRQTSYRQYEMGDATWFLMESLGDETCHAKYFVVVASSTKATHTNYFGTCSLPTNVVPQGNKITVTMPGFHSPSTSQAARELEVQQAQNELHTLVYQEGVITELFGDKALNAAATPSFKCEGKLAMVEILICSTSSLAMADTKLKTRLDMYFPADVGLFQQQQRDWLNARDACADVPCLEAAYAKRLSEIKPR